MIRLRGIHKSYPMGDQSLHVLKGIDLDVGAGELVSVMGASGSGKSTLMNVVGILDRFDEGRYTLDGVDMAGLSEAQAARYRGQFGRLMRPDKDMQPGEFLDHAYRSFAKAVSDYLTGSEPFTAKLNPAYAPYGDYDQLMRLEEWYGRK